MSDPPIKPFKIDVSMAEVDRLRAKLSDTRLPGRSIVPDAGDNYGPNYKWAEDLLEAWKSYDWFTVQEEINTFPQYLTEIEGLQIHFVHLRSNASNAVPLLMIHGWPGSFWEFSQIWERLTQVDDNGLSFDVVVPSLPGFCWSSWPPRAGWTMTDNARVLNQLMKRLGYDQYMVQSGDWGYFVGRELAVKYTDSCKLLHLNFAPIQQPKEVQLTEREQAAKDRFDDWVKNHTGYFVCMHTRPHTIGIALHDNPMGILMWAGEKYNEAADPATQKRPFWTKAILTTATLYFLTGCIMPSMLCYYENVKFSDFAEDSSSRDNYIHIPFGYTSFYWDTEPSSKRAVESIGNLVFYNERNDGGHFAALEQPEGLSQDVRALAKQEWAGASTRENLN